MRAARIAVQIGPIGVRRIDTAGSPPGNGLAAGGEQAADTIGERVCWIGGEKLLIALQRIAFDRGSVRNVSTTLRQPVFEFKLGFVAVGLAG